MNFDLNKVYTAVNAEELKPGDKVLTSNNIASLKEAVRLDVNPSVIVTIWQEKYDNRFKCKSTDTIYDAELAYLVERKENCTNCVHRDTPTFCIQGMNADLHKDFRCDDYKPKTEQKAEHKCETCKYKSCGLKDFNTKNECDRWEAEIKAEKKCEDCTIDEICVEGKKIYKDAPCPYHRAEKHYRPFKNTDELIAKWWELDGWSKRETRYKTEKLRMPLIWVRYKANEKSKGSLITGYDSDAVYLEHGTAHSLGVLFDDYEFRDGSVCGVKE